MNEVNKEFDPKVAIVKMIQSVIVTGGAIALSSLITFLSDPVAVEAALKAGGTPMKLSIIAVPAITGLARAYINYRKNS